MHAAWRAVDLGGTQSEKRGELACPAGDWTLGRRATLFVGGPACEAGDTCGCGQVQGQGGASAPCRSAPRECSELAVTPRSVELHGACEEPVSGGRTSPC